jgi:hypothetical protein
MAFNERFHGKWREDIRRAQKELDPEEVLAGVVAVREILVGLSREYSPRPYRMGDYRCVFVAGNDRWVLYLMYTVLVEQNILAYLHYPLVQRTDPLRLPRPPVAAWRVAKTRLGPAGWADD